MEVSFSAASLRAEIARQRRTRYQLGAEVRVHPGRLGQMLNETVPMPSDVALRVAEALGMGGLPAA